MKEKHLGEQGVHPDDRDKLYYFPLPGKKGRVSVSGSMMNNIEALRDLPAYTRIKMMALSESDLLDFVNESKKTAKDTLLPLLDKQWLWRATGEEADISVILPNNISASALKKKLLSTRPPTLKEITDIIEILAGERSEIYYKETEQ